MNYNVNYRKLAMMLTPIRMRKAALMSFLYVAVAPVMTLARKFDQYRQDTDYRLAHNGQTCYLRAMLNDYFDPQQRRITIEEVPELAGSTLYMRHTERFLFPRMMLVRRGYGGANGFDFVVSVPAALRGSIDEARMRSLVNLYKLVAKRYTITYK